VEKIYAGRSLRSLQLERYGEEMLALKARFDWHAQHLQNNFAFLTCDGTEWDTSRKTAFCD
jgi:hypothetical protein